MSSTDRQNRLLVAEDWKKIYQSFRNADFQSYDFENLRRTMVDYIRQNYPEDFNDYIESSEYLALLDVIAFLGQSIAFRVDLNARENFLELAERRDSVLRLSKLVSYNAKRHIPAHGLLKITSMQTSQNVIDSNGRNLSGQVVSWNDSSNANWNDQFIRILNAAMPLTQQFGNPSDKATVYGIPTEKYTLETINVDVPVFSFTKTVAGRMMNFEVTSTTFAGKDYIYEETPQVARKLSCIFRNDGRGYGSSGSGFFFNFTQGTLSYSEFTVSQPRSNEIVDIATTGINDTDLWLYRLDKNGNETDEWTKVSNFEGNNIIYNSVNKGIRNIFSVSTRVNDAVSLNFSDGTFGNKPLGTFRVYHRTSNGISYSVNPRDIRSVSLSIPYVSNIGQKETLTLSLSLANAVTTAETTETNDHIKLNAPATFYTQNRMITGEDYNIAPLSVSQQVLKVKSINRSASGISRYFDLNDPTGKYSSTNLFADDGVLYTEDYKSTETFSYANKTDIDNVINNTVNFILKTTELRNFYYSHYTNFPVLSILNEVTTWVANVLTTGSFTTVAGIRQVGPTQTNKNEFQYVKTGAMVKFVSPADSYFDTTNKNSLVLIPVGLSDISSISGAVNYLWAAVVSVDSTNAGASLTGVTLNVNIPTGAIVNEIIPQFRAILESNVITTINDLIFENKSFGLSYSILTQTWQIIFESNLNYTNQFSLSSQGDTTNKQQDASWMLLFTTNNEMYTITSRKTRYIFESDKQLRFYYDKSETVYNSVSSSQTRDKINVLSINTVPNTTIPFTTNFSWDIVSEYIGLDGYVDNKKIVVSFADNDDNGVVDDPTIFDILVAPMSGTSYIIQERYSISLGQDDYRYVINKDSDGIDIVEFLTTDSLVGTPGKYYYFLNTNVLKKASPTGQLAVSLDYKVYTGRAGLKFQYVHNASYNSRIDPGASNIIDVYILTKSYDEDYRRWVSGAITLEPLPPSSDELYNLLAPSLNLIKSISDEVIYHPVKYKILFGSAAASELQATFKITKTPGQVISDNDVKSQVITAINSFFVLDNWDFGDTFFFTELSTYVMNKVAPYISNFVIVPTHTGINFGGLFEIKSSTDEILINGATVNDIDIISGITATNIKSSNLITDNNTINRQFISSSSYGSN
jgi:hypothetical protein